jgi:acetyl-CoA carboxylase biotin carboxyl carrier protein
MGRLAIDPETIRALARLLEETGLSEIEVAEGSRHVRVARSPRTAMVAAPPPASPTSEPPPPVPAPGATGTAVVSPMVGTVYLSPEPSAPPFVRIGDTVAEGQTLLLIEAMKVMNPIRAPRAGRIAEVRVANARPVEFGEVLMILG